MMHTRLRGGGRRLFVSRLAKQVKKQDLLRIFGQYGAVEAVVRRANGSVTAYVTLSSEEQVREALSRARSEGFVLFGKRLRILRADSWNQDFGKGGPSRPQLPLSMSRATGGDERCVLPAACVEVIARYLDYADRARMELVSRSWRAGSIDSHRGTRVLRLSSGLWQSTWEKVPVSPEGLNWALRRMGPWLEELILDDPETDERIESQLVTIAAKQCPHLHEISTTAIEIRPGSLRAIAENLKGLHTLRLGSVKGPVDYELGRILGGNQGLVRLEFCRTRLSGKALAVAPATITVLCVEKCGSVRPDFLGECIQRQERLALLRIAGCRALVGEHSRILRGIVENRGVSESLVELELPGLGYEEPGEEIDEFEGDAQPLPIDEPIIVRHDPWHLEEAPALPMVCGALRRLIIPLCPWVDNGFIVSIGMHLSGLEALNITGCTNILGEDGLEPLANLGILHSLEASCVQREISFHFIGELLCLESFVARDNAGLHAEHVCRLLRRARNLKYLDVEGCQAVDRSVVECCYEVTRYDPQRTSSLEVFLGGTGAQRRRKDKQNSKISLHYKRHSPQMYIEP